MDEMNGKKIAFKQLNQAKCMGRKGATSQGEGD
jgi:hypothetical protein